MTPLADAVLIAHFAYVLFIVGGLLGVWLGYAVGWAWVRNRWFRIGHLAAIAVVALEALLGLMCPLTQLEDWLRQAAGANIGFVQRWRQAVLFCDWPVWVFTLLYVVFTALVALTYVLMPPTKVPRVQR